jgi:hypothetical protein
MLQKCQRPLTRALDTRLYQKSQQRKLRLENERWHQRARGTTTTGGAMARPGATTTPARLGRQRPRGPRWKPRPQPSATCCTMASLVSLTAGANPVGLMTDTAPAGALSATTAATTRPGTSFRIDWSPLFPVTHPSPICMNRLHHASRFCSSSATMNCCSDTVSAHAAPFVHWLGSRIFTPQKTDRNRQGAPPRPPSSNGRTAHFECADRRSKP